MDESILYFVKKFTVLNTVWFSGESMKALTISKSLP